jgi:isopenicillin-N epimerase
MAGSGNGNMLSRRDLLHGSAVAPIALASATSAVAAEANRSSLRDRLLLAPDVRYFNAANIGPSFRSVADAQQRGTAAFQANPSREFRERYPVIATRLRARLATRINARPEEIALVRNASEANTVAVQGLALKRGDHVILTAHNHQSTLDTWRLRAEREGLELAVLPVPVTSKSPQEIVDAFAAAITPKTRAIFLSHITNVTGLVYPLAAIAAIARQRGIWIHADGAQAFGWLPLDMAALGVDSYSGSTHKWLLGPLEGGVLYVRHDRQAMLDPLMLSHGYWLTDPRNLETAQKYEILGQRDDPKLEAIEAALDAMDGIGEAMVETQVRNIAATMRAALARVSGVTIVGSDNPALSGPVMTVALAKADVAVTRKRLWDTAKVATAAAEADKRPLIRFSPHLQRRGRDRTRRRPAGTRLTGQRAPRSNARA